MSLLLNMLSRFVIIFFLRHKDRLISWLQLLSKVILEPQNTIYHSSPFYLPWSDGIRSPCLTYQLFESILWNSGKVKEAEWNLFPTNKKNVHVCLGGAVVQRRDMYPKGPHGILLSFNISLKWLSGKASKIMYTLYTYFNVCSIMFQEHWFF